MSKSGPPYLQQEYLDMIQCYKDSGEKLELARMYYINRYPGRRIPKNYTLERVVKKFLKSFNSGSSSTNTSEESSLHPSISEKVIKILKYFRANPNASNVIASKIFNVDKTYIDMILQQKDIQVSSEEESENEEANDSLDSIGTTVPDIPPDQLKVKPPKIISTKKQPGRKRGRKRKNLQDKLVPMTAINPPDPLRLLEVVAVKNEYTIPKRIKKEDENNTYNSGKVNDPFVYTKRIEDMCIMQKDLTRIRKRELIEAISHESRPVYLFTNCTCCTMHSHKIKYLELNTKLEILHSNNYVTRNNLNKSTSNGKENHDFVVTKNNNSELTIVSLSSEDDEPIEHDDTTKRRKMYIQQEILNNENCIETLHRKFEILIVLKNHNSHLVEFYCTDRGNVKEYYTVKDEDSDLSQALLSKNYFKTFTYTYCCWYARQKYIESTFSDFTSIFRFLAKPHECLPGQCKCCCPSRSETDDLMKSWVSKETTTDETFRFNPLVACQNDTLISDALTYQKRVPNKKYIKLAIAKRPRNVDMNFEVLDNCPFLFRKEVFQICNKGNIVFHSLSQAGSGEKDLEPSHNFNVKLCCESKRKHALAHIHDWMSPNSLQYLQNYLNSVDKVMTCAKCKDLEKGPNNLNDKLLNIAVDNLPMVKHFRRCSKADYVVIKQCKVREKRKVTKLNNPNAKIDDMIQKAKYDMLRQQYDRKGKWKEQAQNNPEDDIDDVIDDVLGKFKDIKFIVKEDNRVEGSLSAPNSDIPEEYVTKLKRVLGYIKNGTQHLNLPPNTQVDINKIINNDKHTLTITFLGTPTVDSEIENNLYYVKTELSDDLTSDTTCTNIGDDVLVFDSNNISSTTKLKSGTISKNVNKIVNMDSPFGSAMPSCNNSEDITSSNNNNKNIVFYDVDQAPHCSTKPPKRTKSDMCNYFSKLIYYNKYFYKTSFESFLKKNISSPNIVNEEIIQASTEEFTPKITSVCSLKDTTIIDEGNTLTDLEADIPSSKICNRTTFQCQFLNHTSYLMMQSGDIVPLPSGSILPLKNAQAILRPVSLQPIESEIIVESTLNTSSNTQIPTNQISPIKPSNSLIPSDPLSTPDILRDTPHSMYQNSNIVPSNSRK